MLNGEGPGPLIRFGAFEADLRAGELRKHGLKLKLQEQPFRILAMLLQRPGQVVTRDDLRKKLWDGDTFVDFDSGLNKAMNRLREALADTAENPRFIETLPKRGYRFIARVEKGGNIGENGPTTVGTQSLPPTVTADDANLVLPLVDARLVQVRTPKVFTWGVGLVLLMAAVLTIAAWFHGAAATHPCASASAPSLLPPPNTSFLPSNFEISPDGTRLAFVAAGPDGSILMAVGSLAFYRRGAATGWHGGRPVPLLVARQPTSRFFCSGEIEDL